MKKIIVLIAIVWIASSVTAFGILNADDHWKSQHEWISLHMSQRDDIGMLVALSLPGLPSLGGALLATNFMEHGFELKPWNNDPSWSIEHPH